MADDWFVVFRVSTSNLMYTVRRALNWISNIMVVTSYANINTLFD